MCIKDSCRSINSLPSQLIVAIAAEDVVGVVVVEAEEVEAFATTGIVKLDSSMSFS